MSWKALYIVAKKMQVLHLYLSKIFIWKEKNIHLKSMYRGDHSSSDETITFFINCVLCFLIYDGHKDIYAVFFSMVLLCSTCILYCRVGNNECSIALLHNFLTTSLWCRGVIACLLHKFVTNTYNHITYSLYLLSSFI